MDRSVDSIGSCSLDVDADSTDFSDTSGELNFLTPISGKDITREFTAGIKERCMLPVINCQAVTSVLDPVTGHISTVLTTTATPQHPTCPSTQPLLGGGGGDTSPPAAATNKKPSYLNLACCVNGYSNLTTYDSKLRQDINKSREVSPSRPIIATLHYNRTESAGGGHLLTAPTLSYVSMNNTINNNYSSGIGGGTNRMFKMNGAMGPTNGVGTGGGRMRGLNGAVSPADVTDNASANGLLNGNGSFIGGGMAIRSKVISSQSQISSLSRDDHGSQLMTPKKSFIQQRVEKLYGATAEVVVNKQYHSSSERKYLNNIANENIAGVANGTQLATTGGVLGKGGQSITNGNGAAAGSLGKPGGVGNGLHQQYPPYMSSDWGSLITVDENNRQINSEEHEGMDADDDSLPVMRHLRPEFRKQLQIFSPKKVPKALPNRAATATTANGNNNLPPAHTNGTGRPVSTVSHDASATDGNNMAHSHSLQTNGNGHIDTVDREAHSREEQTLQQENGCVTNRSTTVSMKSARISSHITTTTTVNGTSISSSSSSSSSTTSNGHHETEEITDASSITRHHSNAASTRTSMTVQSNVTEQQPSSSHGDCHASSTAAATPEMVEAKMRSLVVVPPPSTTSDHDVECVSSQQESTVDSSSSGATAAAIAVLPDDTDTAVLKPATVAASVIENGEQNGAVGSSSNTDGLEHSVQPRVGETTTAYGGDKIVGEIVHCDSRTAVEDEEQKQAVLKDSMRTLNGGDTTVVVGDAAAAASSLPMVSTMAAAGIDRHHQVDAEEDSRQCRAKSAVEVLAAPATIEATTSNGSVSNGGGDDVLDGNYFLQILKTERHRLEAMADVVEKEISHLKADGVDIGEDLNGYILVAVGKARLLCKQKIKQFEDLCYTNLNQSPDEKFQTTGQDLRGFWDMVMLQVNNVDATFVEIDSFRKNGWRKPIPQSPPPSQARNGVPRTTKLVKRPYKTQTNGTGSTVTDGKSGGASEAKKASAALAAAKREAQRKQLLEMKRKQKLANSQPEPAVEIFAPSADDGSVPVQLNGGDTTGTQRTTTAAAVVDATS